MGYFGRVSRNVCLESQGPRSIPESIQEIFYVVMSCFLFKPAIMTRPV